MEDDEDDFSYETHEERVWGLEKQLIDSRIVEKKYKEALELIFKILQDLSWDIFDSLNEIEKIVRQTLEISDEEE